MDKQTTSIKHVASPLARQTLLDDALTAPSLACARSGFCPGFRS